MSLPKPLTDTDLIDFGQHEGKQLGQIPAKYLLWLHENEKCGKLLKDYIESNMDALNAEMGNNKGVKVNI